jgi:hypothetical protein
MFETKAIEMNLIEVIFLKCLTADFLFFSFEINKSISFLHYIHFFLFFVGKINTFFVKLCNDLDFLLTDCWVSNFPLYVPVCYVLVDRHG